MEAFDPAVGCRSVLILGGARSGKSRYALRLAEVAAPKRVFIATGSAGDNEMTERIRRHRAERGADWTTVETPVELTDALAIEARENRAVVVDCLTFWLANLAFAGRDIAAETTRLCHQVAGLGCPTIFVSNEVGMGIVPDTPVGRDFRDWQGRINQQMAAVCQAVVFVAAGIPRLLKPAPAFEIILR
jgi:adenosylcobinamide kinase/adenosylcobinamide-phosphate guanylyltransferase